MKKSLVCIIVGLLVFAVVLSSGCTSQTGNSGSPGMDVTPTVVEENHIFSKTYTYTSEDMVMTVVTNEVSKTAEIEIVDNSPSYVDSGFMTGEQSFELVSKMVCGMFIDPAGFNEAIKEWNSQPFVDQDGVSKNEHVDDSEYLLKDYKITKVTYSAKVNGKEKTAIYP